MGGSPHIRAVIFDAVGTLLRLREPVGVTYARFAAAHGARVPASRLEEAFERVRPSLQAEASGVGGGPQAEARARAGWREIVRRTLRAADGTARVDAFDAFFDEVYAYYAGAAAWELAPGAREALDALEASGRSLAVLSNFDPRLRQVLVALGIHARFRAVVLPADAGAPKPDRRIFDACLKRLGLPPDRAVYVGDHARLDVEAARAVGMHAIDVADSATLTDLPARVDALEEAA